MQPRATVRGSGQALRRSVRLGAGVTLTIGALGLAFSPAVAGASSTPPSTLSPAVSALLAGPTAAVSAQPALPAGAHTVGVVPAETSVLGDVALAPSNAGGLATYASDVSDPSSPLYHHYLAPGQFATQFGPSVSTRTAIVARLRASGLTNVSVSANGLLVHFQGSAALVSKAFDTGIADVALHNGRHALAPTAAPQLPVHLADQVVGVIGLDTVTQPHNMLEHASGLVHHASAHVHVTPARATHGGPVACSAASQAAAVNGGLSDDQIADAYGVGGLYDQGALGQGQTIAVYELEPFFTSDVKTFDSCYFGASGAAAMAKRLHIVSLDGGVAAGGGSGEAELDIDDVSALAPDATIDVYEAPNSNAGYLDEFNQIVQDDTAKIVTSSWGSGCETQVAENEPGLMQIENVIFEQAAAQGQTVLDAAGDEGSDGCGYHSTVPVAPVLSSEDPDSQPYVLSVGGTAISDASEPPVEHVWNDGATFGAGSGGYSSIWSAPSWQVDSAVPGLTNATILKDAQAINGGPFCGTGPCREIPDVSAQADEFTGAVTVYESEYGGWTTFGGTSSSTPLWAAMLADVNSTSACGTTGGLGFVTPSLYAIASHPAEYANAFNDVTQGNNDQFGAAGGLYPATKGYDLATGLGSPRMTNTNGAPGLASYLCAPATGQSPSISGITPPAVPLTGGTVTVTGTNFTSGSAPDVAAVQVGTIVLPASDVHVTSATQMTLTLPAGAAQAGAAGLSGGQDGSGTYDVVVSLTDGRTSVAGPADRVAYYDGTTEASAPPEVAAVEESGGNLSGGNTVTIYGSGFSTGGTPTVTFGGIAGTDVVTHSDHDLTVQVPPYSSATTCATAADPTTDVCQVEVVVQTADGTSATDPIAIEAGADLTGSAPTETVPVATEYDYVPTPSVTSVTLESPDGLASEAGGTVAEVTGTGLGALGLEWVNVGPYADYASQDETIVPISSTSLDVTLPSPGTTKQVLAVPLSIQTFGSPNGSDQSAAPSNQVSVDFAPTPVLTSIAVGAGGSASESAGPASGGTHLSLHGSGLSGAFAVEFIDAGPTGSPGLIDGFGDATTYSLSRVSNNAVSVRTPNDNPSIDTVAVCNVSGCSKPLTTGGTFTFFATGAPSVTGLSVTSAKAGQTITIEGQNLGFATSVLFGTTSATTFANVAAILDSGSTTQVTVTVPAGLPDGPVNVRVATLESGATGSGPSAISPADVVTITG